MKPGTDPKPMNRGPFPMPRLGMGTWHMGESAATRAAEVASLRLGLELGMGLIDTAEMYPVPPSAQTQGRTESYLGSWLKHRSRDKLLVATKITAQGRGFNWVRGGPGPIDRRSIQQALDGSLARLQTDYVDLYQIHWPDRYLPLFGNTFYDPKQERVATPIEIVIGRCSHSSASMQARSRSAISPAVLPSHPGRTSTNSSPP